MNCYKFFTKNHFTIFHTDSITKVQTTFHNKKRTCSNQIFLKKGPTLSLYCKDMVEPCYINSFAALFAEQLLL